MDPTDITRVQTSLAKVAPIKEHAAALFYARLFELAPQLRPLFPDDLTKQGAKLMATLAAVVGGLQRLDEVIPVAEDLARRHVTYGARPEDYEVVGAALLWTLGQGLGEDFTPEVEAAWAKAYSALSAAMIAAAYPTAASN